MQPTTLDPMTDHTTPVPVMVQSGAQVAQIRKILGKNQEEFAHMLDISRRTLVSIEQSESISTTIQIQLAHMFPRECAMVGNLEQQPLLAMSNTEQRMVRTMGNSEQNDAIFENIPGNIFKLLRLYHGISYQKIAYSAQVSVQEVKESERTWCKNIVFEAFSDIIDLTWGDTTKLVQEISNALTHKEESDRIAQQTQTDTEQTKKVQPSKTLTEEIKEKGSSLGKNDMVELAVLLAEKKLREKRTNEVTDIMKDMFFNFDRLLFRYRSTHQALKDAVQMFMQEMEWDYQAYLEENKPTSAEVLSCNPELVYSKELFNAHCRFLAMAMTS